MVKIHGPVLRKEGLPGLQFTAILEDALLCKEIAIKELIPALLGDETILKRSLEVNCE